MKNSKILKLALMTTALMATTTVMARSGGIVNKSGAPEAGNCWGCHAKPSGAWVPPFTAQTKISGPSELTVRTGSMNDITVSLMSDAPAAGFNLSAYSETIEAGTFIDLTESGAQDAFVRIDTDVDQATQLNTTALIDGAVKWVSRWQAPEVEGDVIFYTCVNPVDANFGTTGDGAPIADACISQTISVVIEENAAPVSTPDDAQTDQNTPVVIDVLANDSDDIQVLGSTIVIESEPTNGTTSVNKAEGTISYTPKVGFSGADSFTYSVEDGEGLRSDAVAVNLTVILTSGAPIITGGDYSTFESTPVTIDVLSVINATSSIEFTDDDIEITRINNGSVTIESNGNLTYVANEDYSGVDSFNYVINAADGAVSNEATIYVTVTEKNSSDGGSVNGVFLTLIAMFGFFRRNKKL